MKQRVTIYIEKPVLRILRQKARRQNRSFNYLACSVLSDHVAATKNNPTKI